MNQRSSPRNDPVTYPIINPRIPSRNSPRIVQTNNPMVSPISNPGIRSINIPRICQYIIQLSHFRHARTIQEMAQGFLQDIVQGLLQYFIQGLLQENKIPDRCNTRGPLSKLDRTPPQRKIIVTSESPVRDNQLSHC